ncbi:MAG: PQQ-binding-like beta-propeller repeat protein [Pirellulaceae bacterium]
MRSLVSRGRASCLYLLVGICLATQVSLAWGQQDPVSSLKQLDLQQGILLLLGPHDPQLPVQLAQASKLILYVQAADSGVLEATRQAAYQAGLLGTRIYVEAGQPEKIHLASNLADGAIVADARLAANPETRQEVLRVLHPRARAWLAGSTITKPRPVGADDWSHPYHGPDNNPQSRDQQARAPYLTQFLTDPWYVPMPQVTVSSGGRVFKAFGHIALKEREWPWLNSLVAINGYNGTHLWKRPLKPGFMIHRSTLIATPDTVYLGDDSSCKLLDAATGEVRSEIKIPPEIDPDGVWKWMALDKGTLYAVIGPPEPLDTVIRGERKVPGWPWSGLGKGYAGKYAWGFGRVLLAIDVASQKIRWTYQSKDPIDSRAVCLAADQLFLYSPHKYLASVDAATGREVWKKSDPKTLAAIGTDDRAQTPIKGFGSSAFMKANDKGLYFAGPQRSRLAAVSVYDGSLLWDYPHGNFQLILRDDALYAMGRTETSKKFDFVSGEILADLECYRGNCTRATGTVDSIFTRGYRHTGTMRLDLSGTKARRLPLMRPACQDGVIISDGMLYWGPWMCDCNHSLIGMIALGSAGDFKFNAEATDATRLETLITTPVGPGDPASQDWSGYRGGPARQAATAASVSADGSQRWQINSRSKAESTALVTAGNRVYWSGLDGVVRAADTESGKLLWTAYTAGPVRFPPEVWQDRVYVGSSDGWVYCFHAISGKLQWRFRAAPAERKILVHGRLLSNWPIGSGVLVDPSQGLVYAAAGITSYDGTHLYALDARTGKIRWQNNTSGRLVAEDQVTGVSVQGHLLLHENKLYLAGGNVVSPAIYDSATGKCLNELKNEWWKRPADAKEQFPVKSSKEMFERSPRGRELFLVDGKVRVFDQLLYSPPKYGPSRYHGGHFLQAAAGNIVIRATGNRVVRLSPDKTADGKPIGLWQNETFRDPRALALTRDVVLVAGEIGAVQPDAEKKAPVRYGLTALDLEKGTPLWTADLPAAPISWGIAVNHQGRVIVSLVDGRVLGF